MPDRPTIRTERLVLRPFEMSDAGRVAELCGNREIAANTLLIPHPYSLADAESWLSTHQQKFDEGTHVAFAVTLGRVGELIGAVGLTIDRLHDRAELGYWIARPCWNKGYATEASHAAINYGFASCRLERIFASHFVRNPASGRVLEKCGMRFEGVARRYVRKWGVYEDGGVYAIIRSDFDAGLGAAPIAAVRERGPRQQ